jgi:methyl-accepting chemotaxis protein WspA
MFRFVSGSIRTKLYCLVPATLLVVGVAVGLGLYVQMRYSIGGVVYEQLGVQKDFQSDVTPAVMLNDATVITLLTAETETDPAVVVRLNEQFHVQEQEYQDARDKWIRLLPEGEAHRLVERDLNRPAEEMYRVANAEYWPLLAKGGADDHKAASQVLRGKIMPRYREQKAVGGRLSETTRKLVHNEKKDAAERARFWTTVNVIVSVLAVALLVTMKLVVARSVIRSTDVLNARMRELSTGASDLTARVEVTGRDELAQLGTSINAMIGKIQSVVAKVRESSLQVLSVASEIAATARRQEQTVQDLSASTTQVAASVREISATSQDLAGTMTEVNTSASHAADLATRGRDNTTRMAVEMKQLVESTVSVSGKLGMIREKADRINAVVTTITKVADQTNLLSINAAIEAEKAGEYGRGFLVVAREIRRLADQTAVATLDIETIVRQMQDAVSAGVMQMDKFADEVRSGVGKVATINQMTYEIISEVQTLSSRFQLVTEGMKNQAEGAKQINDAMGQMADGARRSAQSVQEFEQATTHLRGSVEGLNQEISQFKI